MSVSKSLAMMAMRETLKSLDYRYQEGRSHIHFNIGLSDTILEFAEFNIQFVTVPEEGEEDDPVCSKIISYTKAGVQATEDCIQEVAEFLHRANYGLKQGNFELDFRDGEIRYKMCLSVGDEIPDHVSLVELFAIPLLMFERYGNGLLKVALHVCTPEEAVEECESA